MSYTKYGRKGTLPSRDLTASYYYQMKRFLSSSSSRLKPLTPWHASVLNAKPSTSKTADGTRLIKPQEIGRFTPPAITKIWKPITKVKIDHCFRGLLTDYKIEK